MISNDIATFVYFSGSVAFRRVHWANTYHPLARPAAEPRSPKPKQVQTLSSRAKATSAPKAATSPRKTAPVSKAAASRRTVTPKPITSPPICESTLLLVRDRLPACYTPPAIAKTPEIESNLYSMYPTGNTKDEFTCQRDDGLLRVKRSPLKSPRFMLQRSQTSANIFHSKTLTSPPKLSKWPSATNLLLSRTKSQNSALAGRPSGRKPSLPIEWVDIGRQIQKPTLVDRTRKCWKTLTSTFSKKDKKTDDKAQASRGRSKSDQGQTKDTHENPKHETDAAQRRNSDSSGISCSDTACTTRMHDVESSHSDSESESKLSDSRVSMRTTIRRPSVSMSLSKSQSQLSQSTDTDARPTSPSEHRPKGGLSRSLTRKESLISATRDECMEKSSSLKRSISSLRLPESSPRLKNRVSPSYSSTSMKLPPSTRPRKRPPQRPRSASTLRRAKSSHNLFTDEKKAAPKPPKADYSKTVRLPRKPVRAHPFWPSPKKGSRKRTLTRAVSLRTLFSKPERRPSVQYPGARNTLRKF